MFPFDDDRELEPLPPMHDSRWLLTCAAVARCIIVAEGAPQCKSSKVYDEVRGKWLRLPCDLPSAGGLVHMGSAFLQNPGACSRALCSCVGCGHAPQPRRAGCAGGRHSCATSWVECCKWVWWPRPTELQQLTDSLKSEYEIILTLTRLKATHASDGYLHAQLRTRHTHNQIDLLVHRVFVYT